jgi:hypothetical protein
MTYLDVSPMITALRTSPDSFEFTHGSLHHIPSRHTFQFDRAGQVRLDAQCSCSSLTVSRDQEAKLFEAFGEWRASYWRPLEINRQFAAHFNPPSGLRWLLIELTARLHRALLRQSRRAHAHKEVSVPAE